MLSTSIFDKFHKIKTYFHETKTYLPPCFYKNPSNLNTIFFCFVLRALLDYVMQVEHRVQWKNETTKIYWKMEILHGHVYWVALSRPYYDVNIFSEYSTKCMTFINDIDAITWSKFSLLSEGVVKYRLAGACHFLKHLDSMYHTLLWL